MARRKRAASADAEAPPRKKAAPRKCEPAYAEPFRPYGEAHVTEGSAVESPLVRVEIRTDKSKAPWEKVSGN